LEKVLLEIQYSAFHDIMIDTISVDLDGLPVGASLTVGEISQFQNDKIELQVSLDSLVFKINEKKHLSALEEE
ncbi:MAG: 50S ribosomal protein L25/general stress protein Ctc, partial [Anaerovorax sp.]